MAITIRELARPLITRTFRLINRQIRSPLLSLSLSLQAPKPSTLYPKTLWNIYIYTYIYIYIFFFWGGREWRFCAINVHTFGVTVFDLMLLKPFSAELFVAWDPGWTRCWGPHRNSKGSHGVARSAFFARQ